MNLLLYFSQVLSLSAKASCSAAALLLELLVGLALGWADCLLAWRDFESEMAASAPPLISNKAPMAMATIINIFFELACGAQVVALYWGYCVSE